MNVQIECDTLAYMAKNEKSSAEGNLKGYEKANEDTGIFPSWKM